MIDRIKHLSHLLNQQQDKGLLLLRVGFGIMFAIHGYPKLMGGPETWEGLGGVLSNIGLGFAPTFMGFMAAISEFGGGLLLILGLFTRTASFFLMMTMVTATAMHLNQGDSFSSYSHALESAILFFGLMIIGPGKLSVMALLNKKNENNQGSDSE